jgi:hypothetical protein
LSDQVEFLHVDQCLRLTLMSRPPSEPTRKKKRKATEELPSSATVEVTGFIQKGRRLVQDRVIEATDFDPRIPPDRAPSFDNSFVIDPSPPEDASQPPDTSEDSSSNVNTSRSVSVRSSFFFATSPPTYPSSSQKFRSGFPKTSRISSKSFATRLALPVPRALGANCLRCIIVLAVSLGNGCAADVYFRPMR